MSREPAGPHASSSDAIDNKLQAVPGRFVLTPSIKAWLVALQKAGNHVEGGEFWGPYDKHALLYG